MFLFSLLFFILDFFAFILLKKWIICSLLAYIIVLVLSKDLNPPFLFSSLYFPVGLFLMQDNFLYGKVGVSLIFILPMVFLAIKIKELFDPKMKFFYLFFMFSAVLIQNLLIKWALLGQDICFYSTLSKIFINIIVIYLVLLGMRGNYSLNDFS